MLIFFSLAMAAMRLRTRVLRRRERALQTVVEQRTVQLERQQEQVLATNVALHDSNEALNNALKTLHDTQLQLVQQAKSASLGTLTAGVAHEPIADSLLSTLNLVRTQYADQVEIRCDLRANPEFECWPAQLNQVFMHLIVNACQAIQCRPNDVQQARPGCLTIRNFQEGDWLIFEFEDNGVGISSSSCEHIFDPFLPHAGWGKGWGWAYPFRLGL